MAENRCLPCLSDPSRRGPCSLTIVARDGGAPQQSSQTVVKVRLLDTNNHSPKISFRYHNAARTSSGGKKSKEERLAGVNEDAKSGTLVAAVTVTDSDAGRHGDTLVNIIGGNADRNFVLDNGNIIRVAERAKLLRGKIYKLVLKATDLGLPPRSSTSWLAIQVNEVNDHPPKFEQINYEASLPENSLPGSKVVEVKATDMDNNKINNRGSASMRSTSKNGLVYKIVDGNDLGYFSIHPYSGLITTSGELDREVQENFLLQIAAEDKGIKPKTATTSVSIRLLDINDNAPKFASEEYFVNVSESLPIRKTFFSKALATDPDKGENSTISYHIISGNENLFGVNQRSGEVYTLSNLDRETKDFYEIKVVAKDSGKTQLSSFVRLKIHVVDVNDNFPTFYPKEYFISLPDGLSSSRLSLDEPIAKLQAYDRDVGINANIQYNWDTTNDLTQNHLRLNSETGEIFPRRSFSISYENVLKGDDKQALKVYASDGGGRRSPESAVIYLYLNQNRNGEGQTKLFQETNLKFSVLEDNSLGDSDENIKQKEGKKDFIILEHVR